MPDSHRQLNRLQRIIDTQTAIVQSKLDLAGFMQLTVNTLQELTEARGAVIELVEGEWMVYRCGSGLMTEHVGLRLHRDGSLSGMCLKEMRSLCCEDSETDPRVDREACRCVGVRSMICAPLFRDGNPIGVLKVMSDRIDAFDAEDAQTLDLLAGVLGAALGKQLVFDTLQEAETRMRVLLENAHDAVISIDDGGHVLRWNVAAERMFSLAAAEALGCGLAELARIRPGLACIFAEGTAEKARAGSCELPAVAGAAPRFVEFALTRNRFGMSTELTAFIHDVSEHKHLERSIRELALTDSLTGLANRRRMLETLAEAVERGRRGKPDMALLFMDLDEFKAINDRHGHEVGDRVLQAFADRLRASTRVSDHIGRLGGDEFVVLAEGLPSEQEALRLAAKITAALAAPLADPPLVMTTSIGISMYRQQADAKQWLCEADKAMYQAKHCGGAQEERIAVYAGGLAVP